MVKKKHPEQEDTKEPHTGENTENKEHIKAEENTANSNTGASEQAPEAEVKSGDKASAEATPDKASQGTSELEVKLAEAQDKYLRLSAEFDNYRKRTLREKMDLSKYAAEDLLLRLLPVMDDFERALSHMDTSTDGPALKQGIPCIAVNGGCQPSGSGTTTRSPSRILPSVTGIRISLCPSITSACRWSSRARVTASIMWTAFACI